VDVEGSVRSPIIRTNQTKKSHKFPIHLKRAPFKYKSCVTSVAKVLDTEEEEVENTYGKC
jgi:hypothetical protein